MLRFTLKIFLCISLVFVFTASLPFVTYKPMNQEAHAQGFKSKIKKFGGKIKKGTRKTGKKISRGVKSKKGRRSIQGIGAVLIAGGIVKGSPAATVIGVALVAAPVVLQKDIARKHGRDLNWSGCVQCRKRRILDHPDRKISTKQKRVVNSRITEDVKDIQLALAKLGLYKKSIDGDFGPGSRAGVKEFQVNLNEEATGILTAEQRHRLFIRAGEAGYTRTAVLNKFDNSLIKPTPAIIGSNGPATNKSTESSDPQQQSAPKGPMIAEFKLAASQFTKFSDEFLLSGGQANVTKAQLLPDGKIELSVTDPSTGETQNLVGTVANIDAHPHKLSDEWARISYLENSDKKSITLNTKDNFETSDAAGLWIKKARKRLALLAKLTNNPTVPKDEGTVVADNEPSTNEAPDSASNEKRADKSGQIILSQKDGESVARDASDNAIKTTPKNSVKTKANKDGKIIIAQNDKLSKGTDKEIQNPASKTPNESGGINADDSKTATTNKEIITSKPTGSDKIDVDNASPGQDNTDASKVAAQSKNTLRGFETSEPGGICRQNVYVSFKFPNGDDPLSHYNILPPKGVVMIDNGDSTAYFAGSCVLGAYDFSYVYIEKAAQKKDWRDIKRAGNFQLAQNGEQCSIELNAPSGSASVKCY